MTYHAVMLFAKKYQTLLIESGIVLPNQGPILKTERYKDEHAFYDKLIDIQDFDTSLNAIEKIILVERWASAWCRYQSLNIVGRSIYGGYADPRGTKGKDSRFDLHLYPSRFELRHQYVLSSEDMYSIFIRMLKVVTNMMKEASALAMAEMKSLRPESLIKTKQFMRRNRELDVYDERRIRIEKCVRPFTWNSVKKSRANLFTTS